jgi:hypothetical protein
MVTHIDGFFSIEQKLENEKQYSIVKIHDLFSEYYSTDISFRKLVSLIFCSKQFITFILTHDNNIFILFQGGEISICGKTSNIRICFQNINEVHPSYFISTNKTYFMSYLETSNTFVIYHISSGEIFFFENSSLKSIFLNSNSKLDYDFLKNNGKSSGFVDSKNYLFNQIICHFCNVTSNKISKFLNPNQFNEILSEINKIRKIKLSLRYTYCKHISKN